MKSTNLALINIEAEGQASRSLVPFGMQQIGDSLGVVQRAPAAEMTDEMRKAVVAALGEGHSLSAQEFAALVSSASALPNPVAKDSFAWAAVAGPADVDRLMRAVMVYHRFNVQAVEISEKIGANDEFRKFVRQSSAHEETRLEELLDAERRHVDRIAGFMESVTSFADKATAVFANEDWTIGAVLVLTSAVSGFAHSRDILGSGWELSHSPSVECLDAVEAVRMELAYAARQVNESHGINLLSYSLSALSGVRRSLFDGGADFRTAMAVLGADEEDEGRLVTLAANVRYFMEAADRLEEALKSGGFAEGDVPAVTSHVLVRKYLMTAAEALDIPWETVRDQFVLRPSVAPSEIETFVDAIEKAAFSAKLENISKDRSQPIVNVTLAAEHYMYSRLYWIDAGQRVLASDPGVRLVDLRSILEMEPEIAGSTEVLTRAGAIDRTDMEELERHLEWLLAVYGLPVSNAAIERVIASKGEVLDDIVLLA
jgi:hypothetical protein